MVFPVDSTVATAAAVATVAVAAVVVRGARGSLKYLANCTTEYVQRKLMEIVYKGGGLP